MPTPVTFQLGPNPHSWLNPGGLGQIQGPSLIDSEPKGQAVPRDRHGPFPILEWPWRTLPGD